MARPTRPIRVAILGGGAAALAAAFELTDPAQQGRYAVTVYQQGWRLGGKGATGRNPHQHARIEEHGLHIWLGCYENAFRLMRRCYAELGRPPDAPLGTVEQAFKAQSAVILSELVDGAWSPWAVTFPADDRFPGARDHLPTPWDYLARLLSWIPEVLAAHPELRLNPREGAGMVGQVHLAEAAAHLGRAPDDPAAHEGLARSFAGLRAAVGDRARPHVGSNLALRRAWILLDLAATIVVGFVADGLFFGGFDRLNAEDLRAWLTRHGADQLTVTSPLIAVLYELVFAFEQGQALGPTSRPSLEAGTVLRALPRMVLGYTGAFMWLMQAGMGDTIFAPLYQVLRRRGVVFKFFHRVTNLHVQGEALAAVTISRQVNLTVGEYDPLVMVKNLPCWPSQPRYEQLVEGEQLRREGVNLESFWSPWHDTGGELTLRLGDDVDQVVLGISLGALPYLCRELIAASPAWAAMVEGLGTVQTIALQLWLSRALEQLGWPAERTVNGTFDVSQLDTWADMSDVLASENWEPGRVSRLVYFTGPMPSPRRAPPPEDGAFPARAAQEAETLIRTLMETQIGQLWPAFTWEDLVAPPGVEGPARLARQYLRWNIDPSERYVQTLCDTSRLRLKAGASGFHGLTLAGDWVDTGLNMGCVEAAVMAGMQASRAISGFPARVIGEDDTLW
ncbi:MAG: hypothetical protein OHK0015_55250 [Chloroflexi bacterium OHK40]